MNRTFSSLNRADTIEDIVSANLDVLVIGGGITGAGVLLDAQSRGMKAALIEMQDFAAGTSSRSTKLVHGGLRYLKQFEVGLVAEVGRERAIVYENGPHVTTPEWMLLPIIEGGTYGRLASSIGIFVYDLLAGVRRHERRKMLSVEAALEKEPLLRRDGLKGAGYYVEYRTDDARLTLEILKEAVHRGAKAVNYVKAAGLIYDAGRLVGVQAVDCVTNDTYPIYARTIVNATGPWVDELREQDGSKKGKYLHHTKGVHIVIDQAKFPLRNAVYFDVPDGRMIFAIPREGKTYVGTTDTDFHSDFTHPRMTQDDLNYLVSAVNFMFPDVGLAPEDVESSWAGVRPLIHEEGKSPSEISRKDEVFHSPSGLITIAGGKLTGYRKMAQKVTDMLAEVLSSGNTTTYPPCCTEHLVMSGGDVGGSQSFAAFVEKHTHLGVELGLHPGVAEKLVRRYGSNIEEVYNILRDRQDVDADEDMSGEVFATLLYAVTHEMCCTPSDYFIRRTGSLLFNIDWVREWKEPVLAYMGKVFQWSPETLEGHRANLDERIEEATTPV